MLVVVGVFRPVELMGRTVAVPREVYLRSEADRATWAQDSLGRELEVVRRVPVPASVELGAPSANQSEVKGAAPSPRPEVTHPGPATVSTTQMEVGVGRLRVVEIRGDVAVAQVVSDAVTPAAGASATALEADVPAVMAGDLARFRVEPPNVAVVAVPPPAKDAKVERARLESARKKAEREKQRRKSVRGPFERPVMRWKL